MKFLKKTEIDIMGYDSPTKEQTKEIFDKLKSQRYKMADFGMRFGIVSVGTAILCLTAILQYKLFDNFPLFLFFIITLDSGVASIIGAVRSKKEIETIERGEFSVKRGVVKSVRKRNCWSTTVAVQHNDDKVEMFNFIGKPVEEDDEVYIVLANREKIKWAIPRICKR